MVPPCGRRKNEADGDRIDDHAAASGDHPVEIFANPRGPRDLDKGTALHDRLRELSTYLHADLTKQQSAAQEAPPAERPRPPLHRRIIEDGRGFSH